MKDLISEQSELQWDDTIRPLLRLSSSTIANWKAAYRNGGGRESDERRDDHNVPAEHHRTAPDADPSAGRWPGALLQPDDHGRATRGAPRRSETNQTITFLAVRAPAKHFIESVVLKAAKGDFRITTCLVVM
jgi:hypothetical protein